MASDAFKIGMMVTAATLGAAEIGKLIQSPDSLSKSLGKVKSYLALGSEIERLQGKMKQLDAEGETPPRAWGRRRSAGNQIGVVGNTPTGVGKTSPHQKIITCS